MQRVVLSLVAAACLSGCGLKGPLYLPTADKPAQKQPAKPVPPVPATGSGRPS